MTGTVIFALASVGCGVAPNAVALIAARCVQGIGGALLIPGSLALISAAYSNDDARAAAIGTWSAFSAGMAAIGPVAGGWVVTHASWRWLFFFNAPVAIAVVAFARLRVGETRDDTAPHRVDALGAFLATAGLGAIVYALIDSSRAGGMTSARVLFPLSAGALILVAFVAVEARSRAPMIPLSLFRSRTFLGTNLLTLLLYAALGGGLFFLPFNLIQVQRYSPAAAGAALLPLILSVSVLSRLAGTAVGRFGARPPLVIGPLVAAAGFALLAMPTTGGNYRGTFFPGILVLGIGMGVTVAPLTAAVMGSVSPHHAGVASGINNAVSRAGGLLAIAALGVVLLNRFNGDFDSRLARMALPTEVASAVATQRNKLGGAQFPAQIEPALRRALGEAFDQAYVLGFRTLMVTCTVLAALGALAAFVLIETPARSRRV